MPEYGFTLILSRPLFEDELDPLFQRTRGQVTVGFVPNGEPVDHPGQARCGWSAPCLAEAIMTVIEHIEASAPGLRVLEVEADPLLTMRDIAEQVGTSLEVVRLSIKGTRGPGNFPRSESTRGDHRLWRWSRVAEWFGVDDPQTREAGPATHAINGWLALRSVIPEVAPAAHTLVSALRAIA
ncbi:MAG TPA: hypothetical protein VFU43_18150 [Streptosporangiaceae bacterium]|nr:hypothetical protein [Streptosporangiaceae bacterium]